ncbi:MAG: nucleotidyltransferase family protein [Chloroflexi bacterium]|nr:nucleotidyltransferase family protein [Chloroflexota bacterium]
MNKFDNLRDKILPILQPYGVTRIALFGSVVRGEETPESDIDILVDFEEPRKKPFGLFKWIQLEEELSKRLGRKADLVPAKGLKKRIRPTVEREMVILYEKPRQLRTIRRHSRRHQTHRVVHARHE